MASPAGFEPATCGLEIRCCYPAELRGRDGTLVAQDRVPAPVPTPARRELANPRRRCACSTARARPLGPGGASLRANRWTGGLTGGAKVMSIKRILVPLPGFADHSGEIEMALATGQALQAHVESLFITQPPPPPRAGDISRRSALAATYVNTAAEEQEQLARTARERFAGACTTRGIPLLPAGEAPAALPAASWHQVEGSYLGVAVPRAAAFDLMVAASAIVMESLKAIAEQALLRTRRPVLLSPSHPRTYLTHPA